MSIRERLSGNEATAIAMKQINPDVVAAFPITPSTEIPQYFSTFVSNGEVDTEFVAVESEHSAMSATIGAEAAGARAMTATSANGLSLMWEMIYIASSLRLPIVMALVNRAVSGPLNIHNDHSDAMGVRDAGWIMLFSENNQEAYDNMLMAHRIAEHKDVQLPVMVCQDGFITSHSIENIELENDEIILSKVGNLMNDTKKYENYFNNLLRQAEDTEFSNLKVTIYKQNKSIVRTSINLGTDSIIIETSNSDGKDILKIQHETLNSEKEINQQLVLNKQTTDAKETYTLNLEIVNGDDKYSVEATLESDYKTTDLNLDFYKGIVNINVIAKNTITDNVEQKMELGSSNNVVLNNLSSELLGKVVDKMKTAYTDTLLKRYNLLVKKLKSEDLLSALKGIISEGNFDDDTSSDQPETPADNQVTKEEINRFNAKFEFYNGTDIPADSVKDLIQIASNNLESVDITPLQSESTSSSEKIKESIKLNIKKDTQNTDLANAILEKISSEEKYNITIGYNKSTGIIETITIVPSNK